MEPVGYVRTLSTGEDFGVHRREAIAEIFVRAPYAHGLDGIEEYSHLFIIFWMHKVPASERKELLVHPKHRGDLPKVGVFSTRHRNHPNSVGLTVVKLIRRRSNVLRVRGLDAIDGTPVLDIKPYDHYDVYKSIKVPEWWLQSVASIKDQQRTFQ